MHYTDKQLCELDARDFLEEETWKRWKVLYDEAMAYRKTLKGKPTDEQREQLVANAEWIAFCDTILWHSARQAASNRCVCRSCDLKRKAAAQS
jgi:hypothetical protein